MDKLNETISKLEAWIDDPNAMNTEIDACLVADAIELLKEQQQKIDGLLEDLATAIDDKDSALLMLKEQKNLIDCLVEDQVKKMDEMDKLLKEQQAIIDQYHQADTFLAVHGWQWKTTTTDTGTSPKDGDGE